MIERGLDDEVFVTDTPLVRMTEIPTPIGPMLAMASDGGICLLEFIDRHTLDIEISDLKKLLNCDFIHAENSHLRSLRSQMTEYFEGSLRSFDVPLHYPGTPFQRSVWESLLTISYGTTRSYMAQAVFLGNPQSVRAVARANSMNRIAIVLPCHRVIGSNGSLTGYSAGLERKRWLLDHEQKHRAILSI